MQRSQNGFWMGVFQDLEAKAPLDWVQLMSLLINSDKAN